MYNLSISQEYLLCAINKKGSINFMGHHQICFVISCLFELMQKGIVSIKDNQLSIYCELGEESSHLDSFYKFIAESKQMKVKNIMDYYIHSSRDWIISPCGNKNFMHLFKNVKESLMQNGCTTQTKSKTLQGEKIYVVSKEECVDYMIQKIRAEILEDGVIEESTIALVILLDKGKMLKKYFSKYESTALKRRLKELKNHPDNKLVSQMINYIDKLYVMLISAELISSIS